MPHKTIATALAFGVLVFIFSILQPTVAPASGSTTTPPSRDPALDCPSGKYDYAAKRCIERPVKNIGKGSTGTGEKPAALITALRRDCKAKGWRWNEQTGKCTKPSEAKADCEAKGANYHYDLDTGGCVKKIAKAKPQGAPEQAEEQPSSEQTEEQPSSEDSSDLDYGDSQPKKKKKKRHYDDD